MFEIVNDDGRKTDGRRLDGYTISSPCEPNGSGELKILRYCILGCILTAKDRSTLRKHTHMFYTPSFTFLYSRKGEMRGTQNEGLFSGLD